MPPCLVVLLRGAAEACKANSYFTIFRRSPAVLGQRLVHQGHFYSSWDSWEESGGVLGEGQGRVEACAG